MRLFSEKDLRIQFFVDGKKVNLFDITCKDGTNLNKERLKFSNPYIPGLPGIGAINYINLILEVRNMIGVGCDDSGNKPVVDVVVWELCCFNMFMRDLKVPYLTLSPWTRKNLPLKARLMYLDKKVKVNVENFPDTLEMMFV